MAHHHAHRHLWWCRENPCYCESHAYLFALTLALVFATVEFWGSAETDSWSLFADAWHILSDAAIYGIGFWASARVVRRPHERIAIDNVWGKRNARIQMIVAAMLGVSGLWRILFPGALHNLGIMLAVAIIGLFGNLLMYGLLSALGVGHEHAHEGRAHRDEKGRVALMHALGDAASSTVVLAVVAAYLTSLVEPGILFRLDGTGTCVIAIWLYWSARNALQRIQARERHHH